MPDKKMGVNEQSVDRSKGAAAVSSVPKGQPPKNPVGTSIPLQPNKNIKR